MAHSLPYSHYFATLKEGRMERFRMIYVWKIIKEFAPSCGVELTEREPKSWQLLAKSQNWTKKGDSQVKRWESKVYK